MIKSGYAFQWKYIFRGDLQKTAWSPNLQLIKLIIYFKKKEKKKMKK